MKIVDIFAEQLFAFVYKKPGQEEYDENEYDRLMDLWTDISYLREFAKRNQVIDVDKFVQNRLEDAEQIQDLLEEITTNKEPLEYYFRPLHDHEIGFKTLSLQKGKITRNQLRLYAIKVDDNCFVITGGAIKMTQAMQEHPDTEQERLKIHRARSFLQENGVLDLDSFYEFKSEIE